MTKEKDRHLDALHAHIDEQISIIKKQMEDPNYYELNITRDNMDIVTEEGDN